jgi:hypothetical protein
MGGSWSDPKSSSDFRRCELSKLPLSICHVKKRSWFLEKEKEKVHDENPYHFVKCQQRPYAQFMDQHFHMLNKEDTYNDNLVTLPLWCLQFSLHCTASQSQYAEMTVITRKC